MSAKTWRALAVLPYLIASVFALVMAWDAFADFPVPDRGLDYYALGFIPWRFLWLTMATASFGVVAVPLHRPARTAVATLWLGVGIARGVAYIQQLGTDGISILAIWLFLGLSFFGWVSVTEDHVS